MNGRMPALIYGVVSYLVFFVTFLYLIGFVGNLVVPKGIDDGIAGPTALAVVIDVALLALFGVQHSVMARQWFKRWWTTIVPKPVERATFVLVTSAVLILMFWLWRPITGVVWEVQNDAGRALLWAFFGLGWGLVLLSTYLIDHFELFGLRQVWEHYRGHQPRPPEFRTPSLYRFVRHPLYVGFLIAFWCTPRMTVGHLVFAIVWTGYILLAIQFEERDLIRLFGERYREYRKQVWGLIPMRMLRK